MAKTKFLRRTWNRYSKLGKKRKKKQTWRRPRGRDNKMREKRRGYPASVGLGYKKSKKKAHKILGKKPVLVNTLKDLRNIKKNEILILGHIGKKKKIEILKEVRKKKFPVYNVNVEKFLKEVRKKEEKLKETKQKEKKKQDKKREKGVKK